MIWCDSHSAGLCGTSAAEKRSIIKHPICAERKKDTCNVINIQVSFRKRYNTLNLYLFYVFQGAVSRKAFSVKQNAPDNPRRCAVSLSANQQLLSKSQEAFLIASAIAS